MLDFTKKIVEEEKVIVKNHETFLINEETEMTIPSGSLVMVVDLAKEEYPMSKSGKSLLLTRSDGRLETVPETSIFYNLSVYAEIPKTE